MRHIVIAAFLLLSAGRVRADGARVEVAVDPRIELVSAAMSQSEWLLVRSGFFSAYAKETQQQFFSHREHAAIRDLNALRIRGVAIDDLLNWVLSLSPPPDLQSLSPPDPRFARLVGGRTALDKLTTDLRDFAREAGFTAFYDSHRAFYDSLVKDYTALLAGGDSVARLEQLYGEKRPGYTVILAPLFAHIRAVYALRTPDGAIRCVAIDTPDSYQSGRLLFSPTAVRNTVYDRFGSLFVAEAMQGVPPARRDRHADWFDYLRHDMVREDIQDWTGVILQTLARANAIRLWQLSGDTQEAMRLKRESMANGYALLPYVQELLPEYEDHRDRYPTYNEFVGRVFDGLDGIEPILAGSGEPFDLGLADVWLTDAGVPVKSVTPGSIAARAGIKVGDTVQSIAGIRIDGSESYLKAWHRWEASRNGEAVPFKIVRGRKTLTLPVTMRRNVTFQGFRKKGR